MKKFILLVVVVASFSLANAQKVTGAYFNNQGQLMNLQGMTFSSVPPNTQIQFPIAVQITNTGSVLNSGDSLYLTIDTNDNLFTTIRIYVNSTIITDSLCYVGVSLNISSSILSNNNTWCFNISKAIISGVEQIITEDEFCSTFIVNFANGIAETTNSESNIYPNPAKNSIHIDNANNSNIEVYNTLGQKVKTVTHVMDNASIDVSDLNNGMYIVKIQNNNSIQTKKIQISK